MRGSKLGGNNKKSEVNGRFLVLCDLIISGAHKTMQKKKQNKMLLY